MLQYMVTCRGCGFLEHELLVLSGARANTTVCFGAVLDGLSRPRVSIKTYTAILS